MASSIAEDNDQLGLFSPDDLRASASLVGPAALRAELAALVPRLPEGLRLGTSSWSFPGWQDIVYDRHVSEEILARAGLAAYASHPLLRTVSVDRAFYRPLDLDQLRAYAAAVPADFRFLVKADRMLTSPLDPRDDTKRAPNPRFLDARYASELTASLLEGLGRKLGGVILQFPPIPPNLVGGRDRFLDRLGDFLASIPRTCLHAVELRTPTFLSDRYAEVLQAIGVAHCYNVHPSMAPMARQLAVIRPFHQPALVVRWMLGRSQAYAEAKRRYDPFDRIVDEDPSTRELIARTVLDASLAERPAFVIANNKAEGCAPLTVFRLAERIATWHP